MKYKGIELKAGVIVTPHNEGISFHRDSNHVAVTEEETEFYIKSEVDKLIAELNIRICEGDEDFEIANNQINRLLKIVRHQKYKRCLAMAEWCDAEADVADADGDYEDMLWYQKWHQKWLELSEKFKEAKCR